MAISQLSVHQVSEAAVRAIVTGLMSGVACLVFLGGCLVFLGGGLVLGILTES